MKYKLTNFMIINLVLYYSNNTGVICPSFPFLCDLHTFATINRYIHYGLLGRIFYRYHVIGLYIKHPDLFLPKSILFIYF